jgi:hypothetical protein
MTPKEKAIELVDKYYIICQEFTEEIQCSIQAKQCALIAVHEIISLVGRYNNCWYEVKEEIYKL